MKLTQEELDERWRLAVAQVQVDEVLAAFFINPTKENQDKAIAAATTLPETIKAYGELCRKSEE